MMTGEIRTRWFIQFGCCSRLDKETSGVMAVAKTKLGVGEIRRQFSREHSLEKAGPEKFYLALCHGEVKLPKQEDKGCHKDKKMIRDLLVRLMDEANGEAEYKALCDMELSTNEQTRKEMTAVVDTLHADVNPLHALTVMLMRDIGDLTTALAELDKVMAEATKVQ
mmetsp:Transcript_8640/g.27533  ORF Transcript_8640/g.27533 Transcript_8640/m.27533 type:complete len:166 (-) Transcript_8640:501-998(-)